MKFITALALGFAGPALAAGSAFAADPVAIPAPIVMAPAPPAQTVAAYVEIFAGYNFGHSHYDPEQGPIEDKYWRGFGFGGAGRAAWQVRPNLSLQLDVWAQHWSGRDEIICNEVEVCGGGTWEDLDFGIGTHLTFLTGGGLQIGTLMSVGNWNGNIMANVGAEAQMGGDRFRVYGQGGLVFGLVGGIVTFDFRNIYLSLVGTFYPRPNIALSANAGADRLRTNYGYEAIQWSWGARAELQLGDNPLSVFVAYQGWHLTEGYPPAVLSVGTEHAIGLGISLLVGQPDLRSRDRVVGLSDNNPLYGLTFVH